MNGVDTLDQMVGGHSAKRIARRLPMVVFFNIVDISAMNAMYIWLKFQTTLKLKNRTRRSYSPYYIAQITCWNTSNRNPPIQRPVASQSRFVQNEQHKEMLPTLFQKETGNQRSTVTNVNHANICSKHSVMQ